MAIYKYTIIKYLKAYSTWIITVFSILLIFILVGVVAFGSLTPDSKYTSSYAQLAVILVGVTTSFMALFASIFAGFKAASMYKDEVEDGTFLIMLSKPIRRSKIIFFKWFALLTIQIIYTFILAFTFLITILIFDNGDKFGNLEVNGIKFFTLKSQILEISALMWVIWMVAALIFSSIALLISTKLSVGTTIGIVTGLGVVTPMTGMIGMFTQKPAYTPLNDTDIVLLKEYENQLSGDLELNLAGTPEAPTLYNLGITTNDKDNFQKAWIADINYQVSSLSLIPSSAAIPNQINDFLGVISSGGGSMLAKSTYVESKNALNKEVFDSNISLFDHMINNSWNMLEPIRESAFKLFKLQTSFFDPFSISITPHFKLALSNLGIDVADDIFDNEILSQINDYDDYKNKSALEQAYYFMAIREFSTFRNLKHRDFYEASSLLNIDEFDSTASMLSRLSQPLFWLSSRKITNFTGDHSVDVNTSLIPNLEAIPDSVSLTLVANDLNSSMIYQKVASAIAQGYEITIIETKEYVNRYYILYGYIAIALILVPIAYFIVRRQDYR